eukprot:TRINITY_DN1176_c1_g1_i1.p2 TRINITY_DN1176_c1_g1~~TRINITY_DN1176_c1_g1_i1.p2  ORF type:complete len:125 (+),score=32.30 TRINITY_DN1176_c1_g1_i1:50-424(+)
MVSKTLARKKKRAKVEERKKDGIYPVTMTPATKGHMVSGKLVRMPHHLKKKRKYRIGTATAHDIYAGLDQPLGDVKCDAARAALAAAAMRKAAKNKLKLRKKPSNKTEGVVLKSSTTAAKANKQ